jgi:hypothetical protein
VVRGYLNDDSVSPLPFRRLAARDPQKAGRVFQLLLKRPGFSWEADGETLLRRHKAAHFVNPPLPRFSPAGELALEHYRSTSPADEKERRGGLRRGAARNRELTSARGSAQRLQRHGKSGGKNRRPGRS